MLNEYASYLQDIQNELETNSICLNRNISDQSIDTLVDNIYIIQSILDFINISGILQRFKTQTVSEFLTNKFTEEYKASWQRQVQELLKEPSANQVQELEEVSLSFEGFSMTDEDIWNDAMAENEYVSAEEELNEIDNIGVIKEIPNKKQEIRTKSKEYIETMHILDSLDTPLFSLSVFTT